MLGGVLPQALNVLLLPVYTRYLSREDFGILSYTTALCVLFSIAGSLTIHSYLLKRYFEIRTPGERDRLFGAVLGFLALYNAALLAVELLVLPPVFSALEVRVPFSPYMQVALVRTALDVMTIVPLSYFRAREAAGKFVAFSAGMVVLSAGTSLYLIAGRGYGLLGWFYGQLFGYVVMVAAGCWIIGRVSRIGLDLATVRPALAFCLPLVPAQFLASLQTMSDRVVLERYVPMGDLGVYAVALAIASGIQIVSNGAYKAIEPSVYSLAGESVLDLGIVRIKNYLVLLLLAAGSLVIAFSREVVGLLASPAFSDAAQLVPLLVATTAVGSLAGLRALYLVASGTTRYETPLRLVGTMVSLTGLLLLVPRWGVFGAALAAFVSSLTVLGLFTWAALRRGGAAWGTAGELAILAGGFALSFAVIDVHVVNAAGAVASKLSLVGLAVAAAFWWLVRIRPALTRASTAR
jgi:O-antigen/teichoic acid export membrane protein